LTAAEAPPNPLKSLDFFSPGDFSNKINGLEAKPHPGDFSNEINDLEHIVEAVNQHSDRNLVIRVVTLVVVVMPANDASVVVESSDCSVAVEAG